jgi:hypothetical protein
MLSFWRDRLFRQIWHPSFEELVLFLDGELGAQMDRVGNHTKNCWSCRLKLDQIERAISEFMESRNASFGGSPTVPRQVLSSFVGRLDRLEAECGGPNLFSGVVREYAQSLFAQFTSLRPVVFLTALCLIVLVFVRLNVTQPVSAKEILFRVREAEAREIVQVPAPVIHEKLQLRRKFQSDLEMVTWDNWNDTKSRRVRQLVRNASAESQLVTPSRALPLLEELGEMYSIHQADLGRPLSSNNYEVWRGSIQGKSEEVVEGRLPNGERATILKVSGHGPFPPDAIVGAEFTVREADWHPVGQRLLVQKQEAVADYSLGEVAFEVMSFNRVPSSIFGEPVPAPVPMPVWRPAQRLAPVPVHIDLWPDGADLLPSEADLTAAEVEARYALHSQQACTGRPIRVQVAVGRIEVEGVVDTDERKAQVLLALRGIPHVEANIRTVAEVAETQGEAALMEDNQDSDASESRLAVEEFMNRYFSQGKCADRPVDVRSACVQLEISNLSREALAHAERAQAQAWALRRLVEWWPFLKRDELRTSSRRLLELMVRDHMDALRHELEQSRAQLKPILYALSGGDASAKKYQPVDMRDGQDDWVAGSLLHLCSAVEETVNLTLGTFAETNRPVNQPELAMKDLLSTLEGLESEFPKLEADIGAELSGFPKTLVSSETSEEK